MNNKLLGRLAGIAFVIGTAAGVTSLSFVNVVNEENYLRIIANNPNSLAVGGLLVMLMGISCATIACWIYPVLSKHHKGLAISAVGLRTVEGAVTLLSAILFLSFIPIAKEYALSGNEAYLVSANSVKVLRR